MSVKLAKKEYVDNSNYFLELGDILSFSGSNDSEKIANAVYANRSKIKGNFFFGHCEVTTHFSFIGIYHPYLKGFMGLLAFSYFQDFTPKYITIADGKYQGFKEL